MTYIAHETNGLWSVANSQEILAYLEPRAEVEAKLAAKGLDPSELVEAPREQFLPTLLAALEFTTGDVKASLTEFQQQYKSDQLETRMDKLNSVLSKVANDVGTISKEIQRQTIEREQQAEAARLQAEQEAAREAELEPLRNEYQTLTAELRELTAWLKNQLDLLRKKSMFGNRVNMADLSGTKNAKRASEIRKRLAEIEGALV